MRASGCAKTINCIGAVSKETSVINSNDGEIILVGQTKTAKAPEFVQANVGETADKKTTLASRIGKMEIFSSLPLKTRELIASYVSEETLEAGSEPAVFIEEGIKGDKIFLIDQGEVEVVKNVNGAEKYLETRKAGECVGEMSLFEKDYSPNATCRVKPGEQAVFLTMKKKDFEHIIARYPGVKYAAERILKDRILTTLRESATLGEIKYIFTELNGLKVLTPGNLSVNEEYMAFVPEMGNENTWFIYDKWGVGEHPRETGFDEAFNSFSARKTSQGASAGDIKTLNQRLKKLKELLPFIEKQLNGHKVLSVCLYGSILKAEKNPRDIDVIAVIDDPAVKEARVQPVLKLDIPGIPRKLDCITVGKEYLLSHQERVNSVLFAWYLGRMVWGDDIYNSAGTPSPKNALMWAKIFLDKTFLTHMNRSQEVGLEKIKQRIGQILKVLHENMEITPGMNKYEKEIDSYLSRGDVEKAFYSAYKYLEVLRAGILPAGEDGQPAPARAGVQGITYKIIAKPGVSERTDNSNKTAADVFGGGEFDAQDPLVKEGRHSAGGLL